MKKKIGLVLGGGGARCFSHLGMIEVLQKNNIPINCIVGSSMGSIIAVLIANGVSIEDIKKEFYKRLTRLSWFKPRVSKNGFVSQSNIKKILERLLSKKNTQDIKIALFIVATNLSKGKLHLFKNGYTVNACLASCAFPGIYAPIKINEDFFVDGGILNNVPADICRKKIGQNNIVISSVLEGDFYNFPINTNNVFSIIWRSIYIPLIKSREEIVKNKSDIILRPLKDSKFDFHNWKDILKFYNIDLMEFYYQRGKEEMEDKLPLLKKIIEEK